MKVEIMGITRLHIDASVPLNEMKDWEPERITQYFGGMAKMIRALSPNNAPEQKEIRWSARREGLVPMETKQ